MNGLRPHQVKPVEQLLEILRYHQSAVDLSDTGTGKTYVAAAVANRIAVPTLVVCPKIAKNAWRRAAEHFGDSFSIINYERLRTGRTLFGSWTNTPVARVETFVCQSCQLPVDPLKPFPCYCHARGIHCLVARKTDWNYGDFRFSPAIRLIVFDECHRCSGLHSLNSEMLIAARRQGIKILGLSATAACSPLQMRALGYVLDLHTLHPRAGLGYWQWAARYGCRRDATIGPGVHWLVGESKQRTIMADINSKIIPARGVRVRTEEIPGFPEREITAELYDIEKPEIANSLYSEMSEPLRRLSERTQLDVAPESSLTKILRARQKLELLKVPIARDLALDYLAKGYSVGVFCDFSATLDALAKILDCDCIIDGRRTDRDSVIARFQSNTSRLILVQNAAGGICISLQDFGGEHPRIGLVFPTFSIVTMRQVAGRFHRDGGKSKCFYRFMFVANSVEEDVFRAWKSKGNNLDALNDADCVPAELRASLVRN